MDFTTTNTTTNPFSIITSDLNTRFNHRCQSDWGQNNLISFVSLDGIYILKLQPENQERPLEIQLIRNPSSKFSHTLGSEDLGQTFDKRWSILDNQQYMRIFLDPALSTHVSNISTDLYPRRFRMAKWSPVVGTYPNDCILAALTTDYQLLIIFRKNTAWIMNDLSAKFDAACSLLRSHEGDKSFETVESRLHSLSFCNICWHDRGDGSIILLASTIPGDIVVWRMDSPPGPPDDVMGLAAGNYRYSFAIQTILSTRIEYISSLQLEDNLLIASSRDGQVVLYDLASKLSDAGYQATNNGNFIDIEPAAIVCARDNIEILDLFMNRIGENKFTIVLSKSTNICWYTLTRSDQDPGLSIEGSFSAIDVSSPATWLRPAGQNRAVFISDDGSFFQLQFSNEQPDMIPDFEAIRTGKVDLTRMVPRGLCTSSQAKLVALISSISLVYEPSKIVAPTRVTIVPIINDNRSLVDCLEKLLDETWLDREKILSTMDVCDSIDYIRSLFPNLSYEQFNHIYKTLRDNLTGIGYPRTGGQLIKMKIVAFLLLKLSSSSAYRRETTEQEIIGQELFDNVLTYYIGQVLSSISEDPTIDLSSDQVNSLKNYRHWLNTVRHGKQVIECHAQQFNALEGGKYARVMGELCTICHTTISFEQPNYGICPTGHRFARCARSLLIVDLQKGDKLFCEHCRRHYLSYLVWPLPANLWPCIFCQ